MKPDFFYSVPLAIATVSTFSSAALAEQTYALPPDSQATYAVPAESVQVASDSDLDRRNDHPCDWTRTPGWRRAHLSPFRIGVGGVVKVGGTAVQPGLITAVDIGRGPAGVRLSAGWMQVGAPDGVSRYSAELTLDFGPWGSWHPVVGAGAGVASVGEKSADGREDVIVGIGLLRLGIAYRLPLDSTDARVALDVSGALPAVRPSDSAAINPWITSAATVVVGF